MNRQNLEVIVRLFLGIGLFLAFTVTAPSLPDYAIPAFLIYLILLQLFAYYPTHWAVQTIILLSSAGLLFLLGILHPPLFPVLAAFWLFEVIQKARRGQLVFLLALFTLGAVLFTLAGRLQPDVRDLLFLVILILMLIVLRLLQERNRQLDAKILTLTKSTRNLELEQKRTQTHIEQLRELYTLEERNRISRDLHDSVGHTLSAIRIQLEAIATIAPSDGEKASGMARRLAAFSEDGLQRLRALLQEMKPPRYSDQALTMRLLQIAEDFSALSGLQVHITTSRYMYQTTPSRDLLLQHALQEFLSNATRHGKASQVNAHLQYSQTGLIFTMKDNGVGSAGYKKSIGIRGVEERVRAEGGTVTIRTAPGAGFSTQIQLPRGETHD